MVQVAKQTKAVRRESRGRERAEERRRAERHRRFVIGGVVLALVVAVAAGVFVALSRDDAPASTSPIAGRVTASEPAQVSIDGAPSTEPLAAGEAIPSFTAPGIDGSTVRWANYLGRPTVLAVWAAWCPHCQVELPILAGVMDRHPEVGFVTVVTSIGAQPGPTPDAYLRDNGLEFATAVDDTGDRLAQALGIRSFPTLYFVDADGRVTQAMEGEVEATVLEDAVASLG